jgi:hypothetical protein
VVRLLDTGGDFRGRCYEVQPDDGCIFDRLVSDESISIRTRVRMLVSTGKLMAAARRRKW